MTHCANVGSRQLSLREPRLSCAISGNVCKPAHAAFCRERRQKLDASINHQAFAVNQPAPVDVLRANWNEAWSAWHQAASSKQQDLLLFHEIVLRAVNVLIVSGMSKSFILTLGMQVFLCDQPHSTSIVTLNDESRRGAL